MAAAIPPTPSEAPTLDGLRQAIANNDFALARSIAWGLPPEERMRPGAETIFAELRIGLEERDRQQVWEQVKTAVGESKFRDARNLLSQHLMLHPIGAHAQELRRWLDEELPRLETAWTLKLLWNDFVDAGQADDLRRQQQIAGEYLKLAPAAESLEPLPLLARDESGKPWVEELAAKIEQLRETLGRPLPPLLEPTAGPEDGILWNGSTPASEGAGAEGAPLRVYRPPEDPWRPMRPDSTRPVVIPGSGILVVNTTLGRLALAGAALIVILLVWQAVAWSCFALSYHQRLWTESLRWGRQIGWWHPGPAALTEANAAKSEWERLRLRLAQMQAPKTANQEWEGLRKREAQGEALLQAGDFSPGRRLFLDMQGAARRLLEELEISHTVVRDARDYAQLAGAKELAPAAWTAAEQQLLEFDSPPTPRPLAATQRLAHEAASSCETIVRQILKTHVDEPLEMVSKARKQALALGMDRRSPELWGEAETLEAELAEARQNQRYQQTLELATRLTSLYYRGALENGQEAGDLVEIDLGGDFHTELVWCPAPLVIPLKKPEPGASPRTAEALSVFHGFWMARCETTQAQWRSVMGSVPAGFAGMQRPVENVSWLDVQAFLLKLRQRTRIEGWELRLPTEDEWEYACRADDRDAGFGDAGIWHRGNSGRQTHPVGERQPNAWNLHDMLGNVWEWVDSNVEQEAKGEAAAAVPLRVCRGGSGDDPLASCQPAARHLLPASSASNGVGFRLVASPLMAELPAAGLPVP